ncbi:hypothetical protein Lal_00000228 [Lupinus albus]|uniref:Uncharacterized protein n=1 Tax=Lupinus albus TaxID=3870 RepID=A0A6A4NP49_LUPAL|nr:hypothetical protein Lalb_Chr21g0306191 [Lupinus albus]KAF1860814.1 hypothetical protein Lal_00000228 [Lupinus albus]
MSISYSYMMRIMLIVVLTIFVMLVASPQYGAACRPLQDELLLQLLPRGPSKPSTPDPTHP